MKPAVSKSKRPRETRYEKAIRLAIAGDQDALHKWLMIESGTLGRAYRFISQARSYLDAHGSNPHQRERAAAAFALGEAMNELREMAIEPERPA